MLSLPFHLGVGTHPSIAFLHSEVVTGRLLVLALQLVAPELLQALLLVFLPPRMLTLLRGDSVMDSVTVGTVGTHLRVSLVLGVPGLVSGSIR